MGIEAAGVRGSGAARHGPLRTGHASDSVWGVVLAGVHAWGSCVLEEAVCRPLLPVALQPLICYPLRWLQRGGVTGVSVCGNSDTSLLRRKLGRGETLQVGLDYYEDVMPRGPAGCVRDAALETDCQTIVVVDGTIIPAVDFSALLAQHQRTGAAVTLVVASTTDADTGACVHEPAGIYVFDRRVLDSIPSKGYQDIKESLIPKLYRAGERIETFVATPEDALRVTDAASYLGVNMWTLQHASREAPGPGYRRVGEAWIHETASVDERARLVGPVLVGPRSVVEAEALLVGPTTIGEDCHVGARAVITRSALWNRCEVGAEAVIDQCILADGARVEAEGAVRETAYVPKRRGGRSLRNWLSAYRSANRAAAGESAPV